MPFADIRFFAVNGSLGPHIMAVGGVADALAAQGKEVTKIADNTAGTYSTLSNQVTGNALAGQASRPLFDNNELKAYFVDTIIIATRWDLGRTYEGPTGAGFLHILAEPATASEYGLPVNPQESVIGGYVP